MLTAAIITITLALVFYTVGVWSEKLQGVLKPWHLVFFWIGLIFDTTGTTLMSFISGSLSINPHSITGLLAIVLMLFHAVWATNVLLKKSQAAIKNFHKFSLFVWFIWLIPYLIGLMLNMFK